MKRSSDKLLSSLRGSDYRSVGISIILVIIMIGAAGCSGPAGGNASNATATTGTSAPSTEETQPTQTPEPTGTPADPQVTEAATPTPTGTNTPTSTETDTPTPTETDTPTPTETDTPTPTETDTPTPTETDTPTPTETATPTTTSSDSSGDSSGSGNLEIRVQYDGSWTGAITSGSSTRSVEESGTTTIDISDDADIVSANAQKSGQGSDELVIQLLRGGEVVTESATSAEFGVASITASAPFSSSSGSSDEGGSQDDSSGSGYEVRIEYSGDWSGSVGSVGSTRTIEGSGTEVVDIEDDDASIVSASIQKQGQNSEELTVQILRDGDVVSESSTTAEFGVVSITN